MKQAKIAYDKCKAKMPNRPPDEIDFGLGYGAALRMLSEEFPIEGYANNPIRRHIEEELK